MKLKFLFLQVLLFVSYNLFAQDSSEVQKTHSISIEVVGLTYNFEQPIAQNFTLIGRCGLQSGIGYNGSFGFYYSVHPAVGLESRFYYNISLRSQEGKNVTNNSANFFSLNSWYLFNPIYEKNTYNGSLFIIAPQWGIRRVYWNHFLLEAGVGGNLIFNNSGDRKLGLMLNLRLGYSF